MGDMSARLRDHTIVLVVVVVAHDVSIIMTLTPVYAHITARENKKVN